MTDYRFDAQILAAQQKGGAFVVFPHDVRQVFGKGRVKVDATFDGYPYQGSLVNMGLKDEAGQICYIIGIRKAIRQAIGKDIGDWVTVTIRERQDKEKENKDGTI